MKQSPAFSFYLEALDRKGNVKIDVIGERIPANFLGVGFDIVVEGGGWRYRRYELGQIFGDSREVLSLVSFEQDPSRIVFGATLKQGEELRSFDGKIASFFLKIPEKQVTQLLPLRLQFQNGILSIHNQRRINVGEVEWRNKELRPAEIFREERIQSSKKDARTAQLLREAQESGAFDNREADLSEHELMSGEEVAPEVGKPAFEVNFQLLGWFVVPVLILFAVLGWIRARKKV